mmetsp:Transcript_51077/g.119728  ORF Transcript_51077/g.119728 Transcript_51077/m.119728 type:complete len:121 (+) Transcript_51077:128-490(+)
MTWFAVDVEERSALKWQHLPLGMDAPPGLEAPMSLKLYLSCASQKSFEVGHKMVLDLFRRLESEFLRFCSRDGKAIVSKYGAPRRSEGKSSLFTFSISRGVSRAACSGIGSRQSRSPWES